jgi:hypothetical protein
VSPIYLIKYESESRENLEGGKLSSEICTPNKPYIYHTKTLQQFKIDVCIVFLLEINITRHRYMGVAVSHVLILGLTTQLFFH